jgi:lysyl-tRNA synthetase class 2
VRLLHDGAVTEHHGACVASLREGDLVRLTHALDDPSIVTHATLVWRPAVPVFAPGTETGRVLDALTSRLTLRMRCIDAVRAYLRSERFIEVDTPAAVDCPGLDLHLDAYEVADRHGAVFGRLITSPEYHMKRLLVAGLARCAQFARCWRAGELGARHQPEFTMLEWYRAWDSLDAVLSDTEHIVRAAAAAVSNGGRPCLRAADRVVFVDEPFDRVSVREVFARHCPEVDDVIALAAHDEAQYYTLLATRVEPHLGWERPVFLTRFPSCHASLARVCNDDPSVCERAELYVAGVELSNAFDELTDPAEQRRRFELDQHARRERGLPVYPLDEAFMAALHEGMPPSAGNALGLDRLVMLALGEASIERVMAFPRASCRAL